MESDTIYYARRVQEERSAAKRATHPNVRRCHLELAEAYEFRLRAVAAQERRLEFRLVTAA